MKNLRVVDQTETSQGYPNVHALEEVLACNIKDVIADFCLADADIIRFYASNQLHGNMGEMVASSAELYFKGETLSYAYTSGLSSEWGHPPSVVLDMEFVHESVRVFFKLVLGELHVGVQIDEVLLNPGISKDEFNPGAFAQILTSSRLRPLPPQFRSSYCSAASTRH